MPYKVIELDTDPKTWYAGPTWGGRPISEAEGYRWRTKSAARAEAEHCNKAMRDKHRKNIADKQEQKRKDQDSAFRLAVWETPTMALDSWGQRYDTHEAAYEAMLSVGAHVHPAIRGAVIEDVGYPNTRKIIYTYYDPSNDWKPDGSIDLLPRTEVVGQAILIGVGVIACIFGTIALVQWLT